MTQIKDAVKTKLGLKENEVNDLCIMHKFQSLNNDNKENKLVTDCFRYNNTLIPTLCIKTNNKNISKMHNSAVIFQKYLKL